MIRNAEQCDVQRLLDIYSTYVLETSFTFEYAVPSLGDFSARIEDVQKQYPWLVCELGGVVIGYAYASQVFKRAAYQWNAELSIYIDKNYHGRGIATAFYHCLEELLLQQGYYNLYAVITSSNKNSLALVDKLGFVQTGHYKNVGFKLGSWHDVLWLTKTVKEAIDDKPAVPLAYNSLDQEGVKAVFERWQVK